MTIDKNKPIDTIHLSPRDKQRLVQEIQRPSRKQSAQSERRKLRVDFNGHVVISLRNPDGSTVRYSVTPRNLSTNGLGFIHGQYVHADRKCEVIIPNMHGEWLLISARISRCKHLAKLIHDVSVVFDEPITLDDFVALTPDQNTLYQKQIVDYKQMQEALAQPVENVSDKADASTVTVNTSLTGAVLVTDDNVTDSQLYSMWLSKTGLKTVTAANGQEVIEAAGNNQFALVILDMKLDEGKGLELIPKLRAASYKGPIIVSCEVETDQIQSQALAAGANAIITKPLDRQMLHQVVEQLLLLDDGGKVEAKTTFIKSMLQSDPDMQPFILSFVKEVQSLNEMLKAARTAGDEKQMQSVCTRIKCGGASYGFSPLTRMAKLALGQIQHNPSVSASDKALDELTDMLARVRAE